jgi:hypothetical protein
VVCAASRARRVPTRPKRLPLLLAPCGAAPERHLRLHVHARDLVQAGKKHSPSPTSPCPAARPGRRGSFTPFRRISIGRSSIAGQNLLALFADPRVLDAGAAMVHRRLPRDRPSLPLLLRHHRRRGMVQSLILRGRGSRSSACRPS